MLSFYGLLSHLFGKASVRKHLLLFLILNLFIFTLLYWYTLFSIKIYKVHSSTLETGPIFLLSTPEVSGSGSANKAIHNTKYHAERGDSVKVPMDTQTYAPTFSPTERLSSFDSIIESFKNNIDIFPKWKWRNNFLLPQLKQRAVYRNSSDGLYLKFYIYDEEIINQRPLLRCLQEAYRANSTVYEKGYFETYDLFRQLETRFSEHSGEIWLLETLLFHSQRTLDPKKADLFIIPVYPLLSAVIQMFVNKSCASTFFNQTKKRKGGFRDRAPHLEGNFNSAAKLFQNRVYKKYFATKQAKPNERVHNLFITTAHHPEELVHIAAASTNYNFYTTRLNGVPNKENTRELSGIRSGILGTSDRKFSRKLMQDPGLSYEHAIILPYVVHHSLWCHHGICPSIREPHERGILFFFKGDMQRNFAGKMRRNLLMILQHFPNSTVEIKHIPLVSMKQGDSQYGKQMLNSTFCLVPRGDSATTRRLFDALAAGCIPIVIARFKEKYYRNTEAPYGIVTSLPFHNTINWKEVVIFVNGMSLVSPREINFFRLLSYLEKKLSTVEGKIWLKRVQKNGQDAFKQLKYTTRIKDLQWESELTLPNSKSGKYSENYGKDGINLANNMLHEFQSRILEKTWNNITFKSKT